MRLSEAQVDLIITKIVQTFKQEQLISFKHAEREVSQAMKRSFIENLKEEDTLNEEAKKMLEQAKKGLPRGQVIDEQKMFSMIKKELAKKYRVII